MKIGICMTGPACIERRRIAMPAAHSVEVALTASASASSAEQVAERAVDAHAADQPGA